MMLQSVRFARSYLAVVVGSAGNDGEDLGGLGLDAHPCETEGVICVGAVATNKMNAGNFGERVDIWGPATVRTTTTPDSIATDPDNFGLDELALFSGTSASTPFVAGAVSLMKIANPNLPYEQVLSILQSTANSSPDPRVPKGTIDVYRAVRGLIVNQPPFVQITNPSQGATLGWKFSPLMQANYSDPEVRPVDIYRWSGEVVYASDRDGELCRSSVPPYTCSSNLSEMTVGTHIITATATDAFGESGSHQISINVVNRPPEPEIVQPQATSTIYSHIPVTFTAFVPDPDETIADGSISWSSSRDGALGTGGNLMHMLTAGEHTITLTAVDGKGLSAQAQVTVNVVAGGGLPVPQIISPVGETFVWSGTPITLQGVATDPEDGTLHGGRLKWQSDIDGFLGTGNSVTRTLSGPPVPCNPESVGHQITLTATDSDQHPVSVHTVVRVGNIC
jgi:serine protease